MSAKAPNSKDAGTTYVDPEGPHRTLVRVREAGVAYDHVDDTIAAVHGRRSSGYSVIDLKPFGVPADAKTALLSFKAIFTKGLKEAAWRVLLWTNAYAAAVGVVDWALDANYLFLREKPAAVTVLDWMGPWPVYLVVADAAALLLFLALDVPFRAARRLAPSARGG